MAGCRTTLEVEAPPLKYKCSGAPDYVCAQAVDGIYNTLEECREVCKAPPVEATHALKISLLPLSWADYVGLKKFIPGITTKFAEAITLYGWLGWTVIETRIEDNSLVIYLRETKLASIKTTALPTLAAIFGAITTITAILLKFGYLIIGIMLLNLATGVVELWKKEAETEELRIKTITEMCEKGELTPEQCAEALKKPKPIDWMAIITYGGIAVGGIVALLIIKDLLKK